MRLSTHFCRMLLVCASFSLTQAIAQDSQGKRLLRQAEHLLLESDYEGAEELFERTVEIQGSNADQEPEDLLSAYAGLARACYAQSKVGQAEKWYQEALRLADRIANPDPSVLHRALTELAQLYSNHGRGSEAEALLRRAEALGGNTAQGFPQRITTFQAGALLLDGRYAEAEGILREALAANESLLGPEDPRLMNDLYLLSQACLGQGNLHEARSLLGRISAMEKGASLRFIPDIRRFPPKAEEALDRSEEIGQSEMLLARSLVLEREVFGLDHPAVLYTMSYLAQVRALSGARSDSEDLARQAVARAEASLESEPLHLARVLRLSGWAMYKAGELREAESVLERSLEIAEQAGAAFLQDPSAFRCVLSALPDIYTKQGKYEQAEKLCNRFWLELRTGLPPNADRQGLAVWAERYAAILRHRGKKEEAERFEKEAKILLDGSVGQMEETNGSRHQDLLAALEAARTAERAGKIGDAVRQYQRALSIAEKLFPPGYSELIRLKAHLSDLYASVSSEGIPVYDEGLRLAEDVVRLRERAGQGEDLALASELLALGSHYSSFGRFEKAEEALKRALALAERFLPPDAPSLAPYLQALADNSWIQGRHAEAEVLFLRIRKIRGGLMPNARETTARTIGAL